MDRLLRINLANGVAELVCNGHAGWRRWEIVTAHLTASQRSNQNRKLDTDGDSYSLLRPNRGPAEFSKIQEQLSWIIIANVIPICLPHCGHMVNWSPRINHLVERSRKSIFYIVFIYIHHFVLSVPDNC